MADERQSPDSTKAHAEAMLEAAEAEIAEAEALAAAARARAKVARLRKALAEEEPELPEDDDEYEYYYEEVEVDAEEDEGYQDEGYQDDAAYEDDTADPGEPGRQSALTRLRPFLPLITKAAAVLLIVTFTGLSVYMTMEHNDAKERQRRTAAFANGARQGVINMTTLDYNKAKDDVQRVIDSSTGEFRDDFQRRVADFTKVVEQSKVITEGTVNAAAVESMDEHSALVLVSATSKVTNSAGAKEEPRIWRLRVTVTEDGGQYKMSKVEFVP